MYPKRTSKELIKMYKNILCLSPHTDDSEICAGATIAKLVRNGAKVTIIAFSWSFLPQLRIEFFDSCDVLGVSGIALDHDYPRREFKNHRQEILDYLYVLNKEVGFDLVLSPCTFDKHQDHQVISEEAERAFTNTTLWGYISLKNAKFRQFKLDRFEPFMLKDLTKKIQAVNCYKSQVEKGEERPIFQNNLIQHMAYTWGFCTGSQFAEPFEVIKEVSKE